LFRARLVIALNAEGGVFSSGYVVVKISAGPNFAVRNSSLDVDILGRFASSGSVWSLHNLQMVS
jgi:hypothetical protein